jgi:hypothetical protein
MRPAVGLVLAAVLAATVVVAARPVPSAVAAPDPEHLAYGVPVLLGAELTGDPEPYDRARHGRPVANTRPYANAVGKPGVRLPQRAGPVAPTAAASGGPPLIDPGSGDSGLWIAANGSAGLWAVNDAQTDLVIPPGAVGTTIYAPTHLAAGNTCVETTTAHWYYPGMGGTAHGHGFWDWCQADGTGGWQVFEFMDGAWMADYVRKRQGESRYSTQVAKVDGCWRGLLYNFGLGRWEEKTSICGSGPFAVGWTMWESHHMMDQAGVCPDLPGIAASKIRVLTPTGWGRLTATTASPLGPYGRCWLNGAYALRVSPNLDGWQASTPQRR